MPLHIGALLGPVLELILIKYIGYAAANGQRTLRRFPPVPAHLHEIIRSGQHAIDFGPQAILLESDVNGDKIARCLW
jgi:hypothetical protein